MAMLSVVIILHIFVAIRNGQITARNNSRRLLVSQKLGSIGDKIENEVNTSLQYADFFEVIVSKDPDMTKETINDYAKLILEQNKNIDSVQLAPNGVVSMIYPLEGNEAAIGHNLLTDPKRKSYAEEAIEKKVSVTQGPVKAKQGGCLVFNRRAIFVTQNGKEKFWGFSIISMNFSKLIEKYGKDLQNEDYLFALRTNKENVDGKNLWGNYEIFSKDAIVKNIEVPNNQWQIAIYPKGGWTQKSPSLQRMNNFFYIISFVVFSLVYWCVNFYQEKIEEAKKEVLTGTLNKKAFKAFVQKKISKKNRKHGIILIDLNNFKEINDKLGHPIGDAVLIEVSKRINQVLRKKDRLSRFGGDEYIIFISDIENDDNIKQVMNRIVEKVALPMVIDNFKLKIGISTGNAVYSNHGGTFEELYKIADKNMYENKRNTKIFNKSEQLSN